MVMTIEREQETRTIEERGGDVVRFMSEHANTGLKLDVLRFWRKYPYAKFTSGIVTRAVDRSRKIDVEEALEYFVGAELLQKYVQKGLPFYHLTDNPSKRQSVLDLPPTPRGNLSTAY